MRWREIGSEAKWFWLARIIRGRSQHESTRRGPDRGSAPIRGLRCVHPASRDVFSQGRLSAAINRLLVVVVCQSHFWGQIHVSGIRAKVGIRTFNIVKGLGFLSDRIRESVRWQQGGQGLHLLRRLRRLGGLWVPMRKLWSLVREIRGRGRCKAKVL